MNLKKILLPFICGSLLGLCACGGDDAGPATPPAPVPTVASSASVLVPVPVDPVLSSSSAVQQPVTLPATYAALAATANPAFAANTYALWLPFHYTTMETEMSVYPSIAKEFSTVFNLYLPVGRVVWSAQSGYYKDDCGVKDATVSGMKYRGCSVSEGTGYGMLISYFQNDLDVFTRLWNYSRSLRAYNVSALTPWLTFSFHYNILDGSSATDADLDIATSLVLMYYKTMIPDYLADALTIINGIWNAEVNKTNFLLYSGDTDMWTKAGSEVYNLSYFSPVALRLFAMVDPDPTHNWTAVLDAMYGLLAAAQAAGTGVFPDWSNAAGIATESPNDDSKKTFWSFNKESVRIPWRIAWDYYWYQDPRAATILNTLNNFIVAKSGGNPDSPALSTNYSSNLAIGADISNNTVSPQWYAAWCATGIAGNANWLNACTNGLNLKTPNNTGGSYFGDILLMMYSQLLNGMYVRPF